MSDPAAAMLFVILFCMAGGSLYLAMEYHNQLHYHTTLDIKRDNELDRLDYRTLHILDKIAKLETKLAVMNKEARNEHTV